jgi:hypothetical protein
LSDALAALVLRSESASEEHRRRQLGTDKTRGRALQANEERSKCKAVIAMLTERRCGDGSESSRSSGGRGVRRLCWIERCARMKRDVLFCRFRFFAATKVRVVGDLPVYVWAFGRKWMGRFPSCNAIESHSGRQRTSRRHAPSSSACSQPTRKPSSSTCCFSWLSSLYVWQSSALS